jgi:hypothetical protein
MFKFIRTDYCCTAPSMGGGSGVAEKICFSSSPKLAIAMEGVVIHRESGDCDCPQLTWVRLERDGKLIFERWG